MTCQFWSSTIFAQENTNLFWPTSPRHNISKQPIGTPSIQCYILLLDDGWEGSDHCSGGDHCIIAGSEHWQQPQSQRCIWLCTSIVKSHRCHQSCRCFRLHIHDCKRRHVSIQCISLYNCRSHVCRRNDIHQRTPTLHGSDPGMDIFMQQMSKAHQTTFSKNINQIKWHRCLHHVVHACARVHTTGCHDDG